MIENSIHSTRNYDLAPVASLLGKYNCNGYQAEQQKLEAELDIALSAVERSNRPLIPYADEETVLGVQTFLSETILRILRQTQDKMPAYLRERTKDMVASFLTNLDSQKQGKSVDIEEIKKMFGLKMDENVMNEIAEKENEEGKLWKPPLNVKALDMLVTAEEVASIFQVIREKLLQVDEFYPDFYLDNPERYYLFWNSTAEGEQCAIPRDYSMADYLRFHCPHNDAHLAHLHAMPDCGIITYCDYMDERAFTEAVAVLAEWQMLQASQNDGFVDDLFSQFSNIRKQSISKQQFQDWLLSCRGHEFHLRNVRLLGDINSLYGGYDFEESVEKISSYTELQKEVVEDEVRKYYHFPGLGAMYTLGYTELLKSGVKQFSDAFYKEGQVITTWHEF